MARQDLALELGALVAITLANSTLRYEGILTDPLALTLTDVTCCMDERSAKLPVS